MEPTCYMCGAPATTREHAPAKMFFPETKDLPGTDYRQHLITVPSCAQHNTATSKDDEYAVAVVAAHFGNQRLGSSHFATKVLRALLRSPGYQAAVLQNSIVTEIGGRRTRALRVDDQRFEYVMEKTAKALFFHLTGRKWFGSPIVLCPAFFHANLGSKKLERRPEFQELEMFASALFGESETHGANPGVFFFQLAESLSGIIARLTFYQGFIVYVMEQHLAEDGSQET